MVRVVYDGALLAILIVIALTALTVDSILAEEMREINLEPPEREEAPEVDEIATISGAVVGFTEWMAGE